VIIILALMFLLNFTGDCGPGIEKCMETPRKISFGVLAIGVLGVVYLLGRFARGRRQ